jgi:hypothetical protein
LLILQLFQKLLGMAADLNNCARGDYLTHLPPHVAVHLVPDEKPGMFVDAPSIDAHAGLRMQHDSYYKITVSVLFFLLVNLSL